MPVNINIVAQDLPIMHNIHTITHSSVADTADGGGHRAQRRDKRSQALHDRNFWHHHVPSSTTYENRVDPNVLPNAQKHSYIVV